VKVVAFFDGGCLNGVRAAGAAIVYTEDGEELGRRARYLEGSTVTNNVGEFCGLLVALELAYELEATHVRVLGDSELIVRQYNGRYQCRKEHLKPWLKKVHNASRSFKRVSVEELPRAGKDHRRRNGNSAADALATACMKAGRDLP
jgi:ribonuclease HI